VPAWIQIVVGIAAFLSAFGVIWKKAIQPGYRAASVAEEMLPLLKDLTQTFRNTPQAFATLSEIAGQFKTDSGSSLRDVINRLEQASINNAKAVIETATNAERAAIDLRIGVEASRLLADQDRHNLKTLLLLLDRLYVRVDSLIDSGTRIETSRADVAERLAEREAFLDQATVEVAENLTERERQVDAANLGVAADLFERQRRVDEAATGVADDLTERQEIIDKLTRGVALDLAERQRLIDIATTAVADELTARETKIDAASSGVAEDLAASQRRADASEGEAGSAADAASHSAAPAEEEP